MPGITTQNIETPGAITGGNAFMYQRIQLFRSYLNCYYSSSDPLNKKGEEEVANYAIYNCYKKLMLTKLKYRYLVETRNGKF